MKDEKNLEDGIYVEKTPSKKQALMQELKSFGISRSEWKAFLKKNNLRSLSVVKQQAYIPVFANEILENKKENNVAMKTYSKMNPRKKIRNELLQKLGLSRSRFKQKMPKVIDKKDGDFEVATREDLSKGKGRKMSLREQIVWLSELVEATAEIRESMESGDRNKDDLTMIPTEKPTFMTEGE